MELYPLSLGGRSNAFGGWPPQAQQQPEAAEVEADRFLDNPERSRTGSRYIYKHTVRKVLAKFAACDG